MPRYSSSPHFEISPSACVLVAMLLLILPLRWIGAVILAAAFHEFAHITAVYLCGSSIQRFYVGNRGAVLHTELLPRWKELICVIAGPVGSLLLLLLLRWMPRVAFCGLVHAAYNLVPIYPLDGGRILQCLFSERVCSIVHAVFLAVIFAIAIYLSLFLRVGLFPIILAVALSKNRP